LEVYPLLTLLRAQMVTIKNSNCNASVPRAAAFVVTPSGVRLLFSENA
jgi:hypothetical protein